MSRPGVTYQDIVTAVAELKGQGKNITIENIRAYLGTGSIGTINKYLRQWRDAQASTGRLASKENLPEELVSLMKGLWEGVLDQALQRFEPIEANYSQEIAELKAESVKYRDNNQRWQKLFNQWQQEKTLLANEKLSLEQAMEFAHKENQSLKSNYDGLLKQLQEKQERIDELHRLHQQTQANLEHYREAAREQRLLDQQQFEREKQQFLIELKDLKEQSILQQVKQTELHQKNQLMERSCAELEKKYHQSVSIIDALKNETQQLGKSNIEYQHASQHWQTQFKDLQKSFESKLCEVTSLQSDNKNLDQQLHDAKNQNKLLASEKYDLANERAQLEGQLKQMQKMITA